jgi:4-carboxymuconolactone decarboxylase
MSDNQTGAQKAFGDIAPKLADLSDKVLFGDVCERPGLSSRDRNGGSSPAAISSWMAASRLPIGLGNLLRNDLMLKASALGRKLPD